MTYKLQAPGRGIARICSKNIARKAAGRIEGIGTVFRRAMQIGRKPSPMYAPVSVLTSIFPVKFSSVSAVSTDTWVGRVAVTPTPPGKQLGREMELTKPVAQVG